MCVTKLSKCFKLWTRDWHTMMCRTSLIAVIRLSWSGSWAVPSVEMTTSTCFNAATRLSWLLMSPCILLEYLDFNPGPWSANSLMGHTMSCLYWTSQDKKKLKKEKVGGWVYLFPKLWCQKPWMNQSAPSLRSGVLLWLGEPEQRWDGPVEQPWRWMVQLLQFLQPPESCCSHCVLFGWMGRSRPKFWRHWKTRFSLSRGGA